MDLVLDEGAQSDRIEPTMENDGKLTPLMSANDRPHPDMTFAPRIAFVQACWHKELVDETHDSFLAEIAQLGVGPSQVDRFEVAGSFEIPLQAKLLARSGRYSAVVAAGLVVDGGIYRHEFVARSVIDALMQVQLETEVPIISVVLTPHHFHEHEDHQQFFKQHLKKKGEEAARACLTTISNLAGLKP